MEILLDQGKALSLAGFIELTSARISENLTITTANPPDVIDIIYSISGCWHGQYQTPVQWPIHMFTKIAIPKGHARRSCYLLGSMQETGTAIWWLRNGY